MRIDDRQASLAHFFLLILHDNNSCKMAGPLISPSAGKESEEYQQFKFLFDEYYRPLSVFAKQYVGDMDTAEEIVQEFFVRLWESRETLNIKVSVKAYFYQSVKNACYNYLNSKHRRMDVDIEMPVTAVEEDVLDRMIEMERKEKLFKAIEKLPDRCKKIFKLSRINQMKHAEIAEKLNISVKTIENQISIALKKLMKLKKFLLVLLLMFLLY